jgi:threonine dehydratase
VQVTKSFKLRGAVNKVRKCTVRVVSCCLGKFSMQMEFISSI